MGKLPRSKMTGTSYPVVADLPTGVYEGIGSVVQAHAILETALQELLFEMFGNALSLHLNFWIKLRRPRFARHCLPNTPHDNSPDARVGAFPVAMVGRFEGRVQITNSYA